MDPNYWNQIYSKKSETEVSWFQAHPIKSLELIQELNLDLDDPVIDVGGGESRLVDHLLDLGFRDLTVLDISEAALEKTRERLGPRAMHVKFIASDITKFKADRAYRLWHDRATFHFLTSVNEVETYLRIANASIADGGALIVSTFAPTGPNQCSGLPISKYSDEDLKALFGRYFQNIRCLNETHQTPWGATQDFVYCGFRKNV